MRILIIDGQGGGVGRSLAERLREHGLADHTRVVGTNGAATTNMMRAGIAEGATGENAVIFNCNQADIIAGPMGILLPNAMLGEITPAMATAVSSSTAVKVLIPMTGKHAHIVGLKQASLGEYLEEAVRVILSHLPTNPIYSNGKK